MGACLPRLHAYVRLNMGAGLRAREDSLDVVQSICREVLSSIQSGFDYRGEKAFLGFVFQAALNKMRMRHRTLHSQMRDVDRERGGEEELAAQYASIASPSQDAMAQERIERLEQAFGELPEDYREVITRSQILGMSVAEIAAEIGRSEDSVRGLLGRGMRALARLMPED